MRVARVGDVPAVFALRYHGQNQALRRTAIELVDSLGRVRGTSLVDSNLQSARGNLQFDEFTWYFGLRPFGPKTPTPSFYRAVIKDLRAFNGRLEKCDAVLVLTIRLVRYAR
jgi:hypothetical protein